MQEKKAKKSGEIFQTLVFVRKLPDFPDYSKKTHRGTKKEFSQPPIVQVLPLTETRET